MYLDTNNLCGWAVSQRLPVKGFEWMEQLSEFDERFIKAYDENNDKGYILKVDVEYPRNLFNLHCDLPFLPERKKFEKCKKLVCNNHNKESYVVHIRALKRALNHELILKEKVHKVIQFNQKAWLKPYIDMKTKLGIEAKNAFEIDFFKLIKNAVFGRMENVRKHRDIKLVTTDTRRNQLASESNYHSAKYFSELKLKWKRHGNRNRKDKSKNE